MKPKRPFPLLLNAAQVRALRLRLCECCGSLEEIGGIHCLECGWLLNPGLFFQVLADNYRNWRDRPAVFSDYEE